MNFRLVHSVNSWLPLTQRWIGEQYRHLPFSQQVVLADELTATAPPTDDLRVKPQQSSSLLSRISRKISPVDGWRKSELARFEEPVVLFSHFGHRGWSDLGLSPALHITRFYGFDLKRIIRQDRQWEQRYQRLFAECDAFLVEGKVMAETLEEMGCPAEKIQAIQLGTSQPEQSMMRNWTGGKLEILIASAFTEKKGIVYALQALGELKQEEALPVFTLHLVGDTREDYPPDVEYAARMQNVLLDFSLEEQAVRHGFLEFDQLRELALQCHFGMHTSVTAADGDTEGGAPVVLADLMAGGLPFITSRHADIPEVVTQESGILCEEKDVEAIKAAVLEMLQPEVLRQKSKAAIDHIQQHFLWEKLGPQQGRLITSLLQQKLQR